MNNIEILEEKIKIIESLCTDDCINKSTVIQPLKYAIENLIQENKELKEALRSEIQAFNKMKELAETIRKENVEYIIQNRQYELHYIPKSKVKELAKKYEFALNGYDSSTADYKHSQNLGRYMACVELLEEGE